MSWYLGEIAFEILFGVEPFYIKEIEQAKILNHIV